MKKLFLFKRNQAVWAQLLILASVFGILEIWRFPSAFANGNIWLSIFAYVFLMLFVGLPILIVELVLHRKVVEKNIDFEEELVGTSKVYSFALVTAKVCFGLILISLLVLFLGTTIIGAFSEPGKVLINTEFFLNDSLTNLSLLSTDIFTFLIIAIVLLLFVFFLGKDKILKWCHEVRIFTIITLFILGLIFVGFIIYNHGFPFGMQMLQKVNINELFTSAASTPIWVFAFIQTLLTVNVIYNGFDLEVFDNNDNINLVFNAGAVVCFAIIASIIAVAFFDFVTAAYGSWSATSALAALGYEGMLYQFNFMACLATFNPFWGTLFNLVLVVLILEFTYVYLSDLEIYIIEKFNIKKEIHVRFWLIGFYLASLVLLSSGDSIANYLQEMDIMIIGILLMSLAAIKYFNIMWNDNFELLLKKELMIQGTSSNAALVIVLLAKYLFIILTVLLMYVIYATYGIRIFINVGLLVLFGYLFFNYVYRKVAAKRKQELQEEYEKNQV